MKTLNLDVSGAKSIRVEGDHVIVDGVRISTGDGADISLDLKAKADDQMLLTAPVLGHGSILQEYVSEISGWQHYDGNAVREMDKRFERTRLFGQVLREGASVILVREYANQHDLNAVAVFIKDQDDDVIYKLGYLPRTNAAKLARVMDNSEIGSIRGALRHYPGYPRPRAWRVSFKA